MSIENLRRAAILSFVVSLMLLLGGGYLAKNQVPPYPGEVLDASAKVLFSRDDIFKGQDVYQRYGLMDHGSVWGHGAQRGPDFSASTLHLVSDAVRREVSVREYGKPYGELAALDQEIVDLKAKNEIRTNRYDSNQDKLVLTPAQVTALDAVVRHWEGLFAEGDFLYGFLPGTVPTADERLQIGRFFFWTAWVASTARPGSDFTYTNNWPADRSVGNVPTTGVYLWTLGGIISLFVVLGFFIFCIHYFGLWYGPTRGADLAEKLVDMPLTPSQMKAAKYFLVVILLFLLQTNFGGLLAHYTIHPATFWAPYVAEIIPYSWAKTWHLQLAIFWIATTWVGSAIYLAPIVGGIEPRRQGLLVQLLRRHQGLPGGSLVLARASGLGVSRAGAPVADSALRRPHRLAPHRVPPHLPSPQARPQG